MSDPFELSRRGPLDPTAPRAPSGWVWLAGIAILAMASYGLYRGITDARTGETGILPTSPAGIIAPVDAAPATALPHDEQWSTLSGPKVLPPAPIAPPRAAKVVASDDSGDDSSAADKAADDTSDDAPDSSAPPPKHKAAPVKVAPIPDEAPPPATDNQ